MVSDGRVRRPAAIVLASMGLALAIGNLPAAQAPQGVLPQDLTTMPLWTGKAPGALGDADIDIPTLTIYMPRDTTGPMTAVIVAPGGGYRSLAMNHEGRQPATFFNSLGIAAFVLKYRLGPKYHHPVEIGDAKLFSRTAGTAWVSV